MSRVRKNSESVIAPAAWDTVVAAAARKGIPAELLVTSGLAIERERGPGIYDRFRDRLVFPIRDRERDRVVGFGGRCLDGSEPKYLNSPETPAFSKGRCLFGTEGLSGLKSGEPIMVVEGYTDVVMAAQVGCRSAVATLGTSLTEHHARMLRPYTNRIILVFDGDAAGRRAAERGAEIFASVDLELEVSRLPVGQDPCDFLIEKGEVGVQTIVDRAQGFFEFVLEEVCERHDLTSVSGKTAAADELLQLARSVRNVVKLGILIDEICKRLKLERSGVVSRLKSGPAGSRSRPAAAPSEEVGPEIVQQAIASRQRKAEREFLEGLAAGFGGIEDESDQDFQVPLHRRVFGMLRDQAETRGSMDLASLLIEVEEPEIRRLLNDFAAAADDPSTSRDSFSGARRELKMVRERMHRAKLKNSGLSEDELLRAASEGLRRCHEVERSQTASPPEREIVIEEQVDADPNLF